MECNLRALLGEAAEHWLPRFRSVVDHSTRYPGKKPCKLFSLIVLGSEKLSGVLVYQKHLVGIKQAHRAEASVQVNLKHRNVRDLCPLIPD